MAAHALSAPPPSRHSALQSWHARRQARQNSFLYMVNMAGGLQIAEPENQREHNIILGLMADDFKHKREIRSARGSTRPPIWSERIPFDDDDAASRVVDDVDLGRRGRTNSRAHCTPFADFDYESTGDDEPMPTMVEFERLAALFARAVYMHVGPAAEGAPRLVGLLADLDRNGNPTVVITRHWRCACGAGGMENTWDVRRPDDTLLECCECNVRWLRGASQWEVFEHGTGGGQWRDGPGPHAAYGKDGAEPTQYCKKKVGCHILSFNGSANPALLHSAGFSKFTFGPYVGRSAVLSIRDLFACLLKRHINDFPLHWSAKPVAEMVDVRCGLNLRVPFAPKVRRCITCNGKYADDCTTCNEHGKELVSGKNNAAALIVSVAEKPVLQPEALAAMRGPSGAPNHYKQLLAFTIYVPRDVTPTSNVSAPIFPRVRVLECPAKPADQAAWHDRNHERRHHLLQALPAAQRRVTTRRGKSENDQVRRSAAPMATLYPPPRDASPIVKSRSKKLADSLQRAVRDWRLFHHNSRPEASARDARPYADTFVTSVRKTETKRGYPKYFVHVDGLNSTRCPHAANHYTTIPSDDGKSRVNLWHHTSSNVYVLLRRTKTGTYMSMRCFGAKEGQSGQTCRKWSSTNHGVEIPLSSLETGAHIERLLWGENVCCHASRADRAAVAATAIGRAATTQGKRESTLPAHVRGSKHNAYTRMTALLEVASTSVQRQKMCKVRAPKGRAELSRPRCFGGARRRASSSGGALGTSNRRRKRRRRLHGTTVCAFVDDAAACDDGGDDDDRGDDGDGGGDDGGDLASFIVDSEDAEDAEDTVAENNSPMFYARVDNARHASASS